MARFVLTDGCGVLAACEHAGPYVWAQAIMHHRLASGRVCLDTGRVCLDDEGAVSGGPGERCVYTGGGL